MTTLDSARIHEKFRPFVGDNHNRLLENADMMFGSVSFGDHMGKPLSDGLWQDLEFRLHATTLRIHHTHDAIWCDGRMFGAVDIWLDDDYLVRGIDFSPHMPPAIAKAWENAKDDFKVIEKIGPVIMNMHALDKIQLSEPGEPTVEDKP